ncbi:hypothetical protein K2173_021448 [Erythroxylum novogranatense]|uniref:Potassium transporter n=1 Tax=Erythroxylum novogranatense TaxID=1862640 RepID=A0AAV8TV11_9ROSI|nr:hypothetical protein K2173_021448 [Erythroxylum novogranatense]
MEAPTIENHQLVTVGLLKLIFPHSFSLLYWGTIMKLAFQCIGVAFGDLGTSPLYTMPGVFSGGVKHRDDVLGAMSLIFYCIVLISLIKYVIIVLSANDNGEGGTFALYSLICRYAKVNLIPNHQAEDRKLSNYNLEMPSRRNKMASAVRSKLENSYVLRYLLLVMAMTGVSMLIGDGIFTPCISVLSAVGGIKQVSSSLTDTWVMFGTDKVGYTFAPILLLWFIFIAGVGFFNILHHDPGIIKAVNPYYILTYFLRSKKDAWVSLGGVILCLTGSEALFADLGHFYIRSIQISTCSVLLPSVLLNYFGQCAYLQNHGEDALNSFYSSVPKILYWPLFVVAVLAAIIASQSLISASFSIVKQAVALGCFPHVKVVHTSSKYEGQVYVPAINTLLMLICVAVTLGFKDTLQMGNAFGMSVACVFCITSVFLVLVMVMIWKTHPILIILYVLTIGSIEFVILSSVFYKFVDGGYLPLLIALIMGATMLTWHYGYRKKYTYEFKNKVATEKLTDIIFDQRIHRIQGVGLFYTHLVDGIAPIFTHYVSNVPALHSVLVFLTIKAVPISRVLPEERFLFQRVRPDQLIFRCIVRYGYHDSRKEQSSFEETLMNELNKFILHDDGEEAEREVELIDNALRYGGVVYLMGEGEILCSKGSFWMKKLVVDYFYKWLTRNVREPDEIFMIPRKRLLKVG